VYICRLPFLSLNLPQLSSIKQTQPPLLIFAGAGIGKTTTITSRIAYMVEKANNLEYKTFINSKMNKLIQK
jgi:DNA helicase-2/ATP-dependent DNA helicase PcrA